MKRLLMILVALSLGACALPQMSIGGPAPAPLAATTIDDTGLEAAWKSYDVAVDAINLWLDKAPEVIGTPRGRKIADANDKVLAALIAAENAAAALSTTDYKVALEKAKAAFIELRLALKGN